LPLSAFSVPLDGELDTTDFGQQEAGSKERISVTILA
jgi:hypothetical protein